MTDYISKAEAINTILGDMQNGESNMEEIFNTALRKAASRIETIPAADVVEVVRCRNCKYCYEEMPNALWCQGRGWPNGMVLQDGYCDKGKRREAAR